MTQKTSIDPSSITIKKPAIAPPSTPSEETNPARAIDTVTGDMPESGTSIEMVPDHLVPTEVWIQGTMRSLSYCREHWEELDGTTVQVPSLSDELPALFEGNNGFPTISLWPNGSRIYFSLTQFENLGVDTIHITEPLASPAMSEKACSALRPPSSNDTLNPASSIENSSSPVVDDSQPGQVAMVNNETANRITGAIQSLAKPAAQSIFPHIKETANSTSILGTYENFNALFKHYHIDNRYNAISKLIETTIDGYRLTSDNAEEKVLAHLHSLAALHSIPDKNLPRYMVASAYDNAFNPAIEWIESSPWDGIDRLVPLYNTVTQREDFPEELKITYVDRWLNSAVAALYAQNFRSRGVLTFQGPEAIGKTSWVGALVDDPYLRQSLIKLDHHLDPRNKDTVITAIRHWLVELGEVESSLKNFSRLKPAITADRDKLRVPYGRIDSDFKRSTVFFASVNEETFLVDDGQNTRWWTIPVVALDYTHNLNMQQLWAQVKQQFFDKGEQWWLTKEEERLLIMQNRKFRAVNTIRELVAENIDLEHKDDLSTIQRLGASELLQKLGITNPTNRQSRDCGGALREFLGEPVARSSGTIRWDIPFRANDL